MIEIKKDENYVIHDWERCGAMSFGRTKDEAITNYEKELKAYKEKVLKELANIKELEDEILVMKGK